MPALPRNKAAKSPSNVTQLHTAAQQPSLPWPAGYDMEQYWARGYHLSLPLTLEHVDPLAHLIRFVIGSDYNADNDEDGDGNVTTPVTFVRRDAERVFMPIVNDTSAVHEVAVRLSQQMNYCPPRSRIFVGQPGDASEYVGTEFKPDVLGDRTTALLPDSVTILYDKDAGFVGLNGWRFTDVCGDTTVGGATEVEAAQPKAKRGAPARMRHRPILKPQKNVAPLVERQSNTLVIDLAGTMIVKGTSDDAKTFIEYMCDTVKKYAWPALKTVILTGLHVELNMIEALRLMPDKTGAVSGIVAVPDRSYLKGVSLILSTGTLASVRDFEEQRVAMSAHAYASMWVSKFKVASTVRMQKTQAEISRLETKLVDLNRKYGEQQFLSSIIKDVGANMFEHYIAKIRLVPGVAAVRFNQEGVTIITEDIWYRGPYSLEHGPRFFGRYKFVVDLMTGAIGVQNMALHTAGQPSMCIDCMGQFSAHISDAMRNLDYAALARVLLEYVRSPNSPDEGRGNGSTYRDKFRDYAPEKPVASSVKMLYSGAGLAGVGDGSDYED